MTVQSQLEINGSIAAYPFAELAAEIAQDGLNGSVRAEFAAKKTVVYFRGGRIAFAVSNERSSRLFDILLRQGRIRRDVLVKIPNFSNDFEFAAAAVRDSILTEEQRDVLFVEQIKSILIDLMSWTEGSWSFTSLSRIREGLDFELKEDQMLVDYGRCLPSEMIVKRFRSLDETFTRSEELPQIELRPNEIRLLSTLTDNPISAYEIIKFSPLDESATLDTLYTLWLVGAAKRTQWQSAFSEITLASMRNARLGIVREAVRVATPSAEPEVSEVLPVPETAAEVAAPISLEDYLSRVESASTYYDVLGVATTAELAVIKRSYFSLAKLFHPDHFYREGGAVHKRVQHAFAELASAHEALRTAESREIYDYKVRKEIAQKEEMGVVDFDEESRRRQQAGNEFERGFSLLLDNDAQAATPFLARAAHFDPQNSRYRAYYGRALAADENKRHQAEAEIQAAIRIDGNNAQYRIMLAEFFIQFNLLKRAEGELTRLLASFPNNSEARDLLASIK